MVRSRLSSSASPPPGNRGAFARVVSHGVGHSQFYRGPGAGHLTHVFSKVPWMSSSGKTRRLSKNGLSVRD